MDFGTLFPTPCTLLPGVAMRIPSPPPSYAPGHMSFARRQLSSYSLPWDPQISSRLTYFIRNFGITICQAEEIIDSRARPVMRRGIEICLIDKFLLHGCILLHICKYSHMKHDVLW